MRSTVKRRENIPLVFQEHNNLHNKLNVQRRSFLIIEFFGLLDQTAEFLFLQERYSLLVVTSCEQIVLSLPSFCLIATQFQGIHYHVL